ncbi:uncharacterized protein LOC121868992 isoform X2 [Homarus americanus]|nr:uncharacterized protein LOC121868992 isoform X2 [Homarus americanus]
MPSCVPKKFNVSQASCTYNILMADVSGSMRAYWDSFMSSWNKYVAPNLVGRTNLYVFDYTVLLARSGTMLEEKDFYGGGTHLTGALQTIVSEVYQCKERYINVFLLTDGNHNSSAVSPETVINMMAPAVKKTCNVYVLGVGTLFPVQYSINIRSRLHNGSANLPSIFWAKKHGDIENQVKDISSKISSNYSQSLKLSMAGNSLPGVYTKNVFHLSEWVYFPSGPDQVRQLTIRQGQHVGHISLEPKQMPISVMIELFRQWNSVVIQIHNKKEVVPSDALPFMERLFKHKMEELRGADQRSIRQRLERKELVGYETEFNTLLNKIKAILTTEKFRNELELAENILSTTVGGGKYGTKVLQMKGHTDKDYKKDCEEFLKVYEENKTMIKSINNTPEDNCRFTLTSTVTDLQDPDFPLIMDVDKFQFLKQFTITGIPVFAPSRDSVTMNPWTFGVQGLVGAPYNVMSQVGIESFVDSIHSGEPSNSICSGEPSNSICSGEASNSICSGEPSNSICKDKSSKDIQLKIDDKNIRLNAIVPVFTPGAAKIMAPIVHTRLYTMCTTFAILKNPFIIDFNVHMAALGVTWVRILFENPTQPRSEFVRRRIENIEATAALYLRRPSYVKYWNVLKDDTAQALMTESTIQQDNRPLKCESLIKPMFILHMYQVTQNFEDTNVVAQIVRLMLIEYVGRCLTHYKSKDNEAKPFTDFFAETLVDQERKKEWVQKYIADTKKDMAGDEDFLLEDFYTLEKVQNAARKTAAEEIKNLKEKLKAQIPIVVNTQKVEQLRSVSTAGDMSWFTLRTFAREVGLAENVISDLFSEQSMFMYTAHALLYRASRDRLSTPMADYNASRTIVTKRVQEENSHVIAKDLKKELIEHLQSSWLEAYSAAHKQMVQPMTRQEILAEAPQRGVSVTDSTFDQVYKRYRPGVGLMGNACLCRDCPYFLIPNKSYNQHASVERRYSAAFPHGLHGVTYNHRDSDLSTILSSLESGTFFKPTPRQAVEHLTDEIVSLKEMYKEIHKSSLPASTQPPSGVGGNMQ